MAQNIFLEQNYSRSGKTYKIKSGEFKEKNIDKQFFCWLEDPAQKLFKIPTKNNKDSYTINFKTPEEGYHNLYTFYNCNVKNNTKYFIYSQANFRVFFMRGKPKGEQPPPGKTLQNLDNENIANGKPLIYFELLDKKNNKDSTYRITGGILPVKVYFKNNPIKNAKVTFISEKKWQKSIMTNADGIAQFTIIRDSFENKISKSMLGMADAMKCKILVEYKINIKKKNYDQEVYKTSTILSIYPSPYDWYSRKTGYIIFVISCLTICGFFIVIKAKGRRV
ncbi:hypothetical protein AAEX28_01535 [Lentisphaerota bacterium WC36G]|nr:DUF4198 domain-containing protein [Lentisphaerae bacterium WC36]